MSPNFLPDDFVISIKYPFQKIKVQDVVMVEHPTYGKMIKRVSSTTHEGIWLVGDNFASVTTEQMGLLTYSRILGKVIHRVKKK